MTVPIHPLERYRPIVDDFDDFLEAAIRPLPVCVVTNRRRIQPDELVRWLEKDGLDPRPVPFMPGAFHLAPDAKIATSRAHRLGLLRIQESVATLPVTLLDPRPGERVLDLCAAPGNKTAQIVDAMDDRGTVVAVDKFQGRVGLVRQNAERLGHTSLVTLIADGVSLPAQVGTFDRVLADVPCSCEGTSRKNPRILDRIARSKPWRTFSQVDLLRKAVQLCRPGGRVAYATCTYAPEQNEAVVQAVIDSLPEGTLRLLDTAVPDLRARPGLTDWQLGGDRSGKLHPDMARALRVYPHLNDTGGFFVALLEKARPLPNEATSPSGSIDTGSVDTAFVDTLPRDEADRFAAILTDDYGIEGTVVDGLRFVRTRRHRISMIAAGLSVPAAPAWHTVGMSAFRTDSDIPHLTTDAALRLGNHATRNVIDLEDDQVDAFFDPAPNPIAADQLVAPRRGRLAIVRGRGAVLGFGRVTGDARPGSTAMLESRLPRRRSG